MIYEFGPFHLNLANRQLLRNGQTVLLQSKTFETLALLVQHQGQLVEKKTFMQAIWRDAFVEDGSLTVNISLLRKTLGEDQTGLKYIETIPRRGYRFVAPVREVGERPTIPPETKTLPLSRNGMSLPLSDLTGVALTVTSPNTLPELVPQETLTSHPVKRRRMFLLTAASAAVVATLGYEFWPHRPRTIATLPFANLKPEAETNYLGYSLAEAIATKLGSVQLSELKLISTIYQPSQQPPNPQQAAAQLRADLLLAGDYLKDGESLHITVKLVTAATWRVEWQDKFAVNSNDPLPQVLDQVARRVILALGARLTETQAKLLAADVPRDPVAYEYYLRGIELYSQEQLRPAIELLEKSVALDRQYARAWEYLGSAYTVQASTRFGGREYYEKARRALDTAIKLNPEGPRPRVFLADLLIETNRVEEAIPWLYEVLTRDQQHAPATWELSYAYRYAGLLEESIKWGEQAMASDPSFKLTSAVFISYLYSGEYEKFLASLATVNDTAYVIFYRGFANYYLKNIEPARTAFERAYQQDPTLLQACIGKALSYGLAGKTSQGIALLAQVEQEVASRGVTDAEGVFKIAQSYAVMDDETSALRMLRRSIEGGFFCYPYLQKDPLLERLQGNSEFERLLEVARQRHNTFKHTFADKL